MLAFFIGLFVVGLVVLLGGWVLTWRKIVPADEAHVVIQTGKMRLFTSHKDYTDKYKGNTGVVQEGKAVYYKVPEIIPKWGMEVHEIPLKILPINVSSFKAFDKDRARFLCNIIAYVVINDPIEAARRFGGNLDLLKEDVRNIVQATTRDATTKVPIREIINDREGIVKEIKDPLKEAIQNWGLDLRDIELVEFSDPPDSHVINDISSIIEEQINSEARQKNAEQQKLARMKEAESDELARKREIARDELVARREQERDQKVAELEKLAKEKQLDVERVKEVKTQEIEKERAIVEAEERKRTGIIKAEQDKEMEKIRREQKRLDGEGERLRREEIAKGEAAPIREMGQAEADVIKLKGLAEAEAKDKLQAALNKFGDEAIRALVAEKIVDMEKAVGIATADALRDADLRVFAGNNGNSGFDLGSMVESIKASSDTTANSVLNKIARPNDLGFKDVGKLVGIGDELSNKPKEWIPPKRTPSTRTGKKTVKQLRDEAKQLKD